MYNILYETTNLANNKIYIGVHCTDDLEDGYFGSGTVLRRAIKKYGLASFKRRILEQFETIEAAFVREAEIVNMSFLARKDIYNIRLGGDGGDYLGWLRTADPQKYENIRQKLREAAPKTKSEAHKRAISKSKKGKPRTWKTRGNTGNKHSEEFKAWQAERTKNRRWYTNGIDNLYLWLSDIPPEGFYPGRKVTWDHPSPPSSKGIPKSEESKKKLSETRKAKHIVPGNKGKKKIIIDGEIHYL